ncbi:ornithine cyclodeaminase [Acinetobacter sp. S40]|uniref:ornithine cyclodeaminase family protein n=1 Tax=Acinetobacter sp. S40 TaxID=2767434 RepID=UPI00190AE172|nr:ornithine cyclodeaminase [Acinetobacter sp. S40]MBJ9984622.1 ornithine cyclodeaminase [Acinetobacter sp. S40]
MNFLNYEQAKNAINWHEAVNAIRQGHLLPRAHLHDVLIGPAEAMLLNRTARIEGLGYGVKVESVFNENASKGLPNTHGAVLAYSPENGVLRGVIDSHIITDFKTAADSVLGASLLARPESNHLVIIGAGRVAKNLAQAYSALFTELKKISIWARQIEQAKKLVDELKLLSLPAQVATNLPDTLATADIVSSATMAKQPVVLGKWIRAGTHVDLIGAFTADMREADDELMARAQLYVDNLETTKNVGELSIPMNVGMIPADHVLGDLYDLVAKGQFNTVQGHGITVFKNGGGAHLDLMIADCVLKKLGL